MASDTGTVASASVRSLRSGQRAPLAVARSARYEGLGPTPRSPPPWLKDKTNNTCTNGHLSYSFIYGRSLLLVSLASEKGACGRSRRCQHKQQVSSSLILNSFGYPMTKGACGRYKKIMNSTNLIAQHIL